MSGPGAPAVHWLALAGPPPDAVARALLGEPGADAELEPLSPAQERRGKCLALRASLGSGEQLFAKRFPGRPALRSALSRRSRPGSARREWRALLTLAGAGAPVPQPIALGRLRGGDWLLVTRFVAAPSLASALSAGAVDRATAQALGSALARLHGCGFVHGDLRAANVLLARGGPVFVDLRAARCVRAPRARLRDLAMLDRSLARSLRLVDRVRLHATALGLRRPIDTAGRAALRDVARLSRALGVTEARARMRRACRPGRRITPSQLGALRGLRSLSIDPEDLAAALAAPPGSSPRRRRVRWLETPERRLAVKEFRTGLRGALADGLRGSPARRAWRAGVGLAVLGVDAPRPLAFLERRRFGIPFSSVLVQEDLCPARAADAPAPGLGCEHRVEALARLARTLHSSGAAHRDLTAGNVLLVRGRVCCGAYLVDLEDVRIPGRLGDRARIRALAQLNASLPDWIPDALRRRALRRYATWLPFRRSIERVESRIADESRARRHHWSGRACAPSPGERLRSSRS